MLFMLVSRPLTSQMFKGFLWLQEDMPASRHQPSLGWQVNAEAAIFRGLVTRNFWQWANHKTTPWQKFYSTFKLTENFPKIFIQHCVTTSRVATDSLKWRGLFGFDMFLYYVEIFEREKSAVFTIISERLRIISFCRKALGSRSLYLRSPYPPQYLIFIFSCYSKLSKVSNVWGF